MAFQFGAARREKLNLRIGVFGLSGSGKTRGALLVAYGLCHDWSKVFLIDADNRSSLGYANDPVSGIGEFMFGALDAPYTAQRYQEAIAAAAKAGAAVVIVDTMSQEWAGEGGVMEQHDAMSGNSYTNWGKVNPAHYSLINFITHKAPCHVIVNFRAKMKYALQETEQDGHKKTTVARLGEGPVMRPGTEYEFHLTLECDRDTYRAGIITKRGSMLPDMRPVELNVELGERLAAWAESGIANIDDGKLQLVTQLREFYPGGGKEVAAMLKQLGLTYTVELHDSILSQLKTAKQPQPEPNGGQSQEA